MALLEAYFDESGTHAGSTITAIAGYVATKETWGASEERRLAEIRLFADRGHNSLPHARLHPRRRGIRPRRAFPSDGSHQAAFRVPAGCRNCRDREADERAANDALRKAAAAKAATDRATRLEGDADAQRRILADLGPIVVVSVQGSALAKLFRLPDDEAGFVATAQQFGIAAVVELIILICLIGWEVLGHAPGSPTMGAPMAQTEPEPVPVKVAPLPRPTLVASRKEAPAGPIRRIMHDALEPARGRRVELGQGYLRYAAICKAEGRTPVTPDQYMDAMVGFCKETGIRTKIEGNRIYLMGVQLAALPAKAGSLPKDEEAAHA